MKSGKALLDKVKGGRLRHAIMQAVDSARAWCLDEDVMLDDLHQPVAV
jgi:hypothetical protein